jgi:hypothetical protein
LGSKISSENKDRQGCPLVFVGHGYGGLVLKKALVKLHDQSGLYKELRSNLCGIVFYGGTNTKLTNKHDPMFLENQGWLSKLVNLKFGSDALLLELSKHFEAALDLKKVKVCVVNKNKSIMQVCYFYPYSNWFLRMRYVYFLKSIDIIAKEP